MTREPIGDIKCPWCGRSAELHRSEDRPKLNPDGATPKPSYPKKLFVICPPISGYRGCGTTLANAAQAQERMMENAHVFGAGERKRESTVAPAPSPPLNGAKPPAPILVAPPVKKSLSFMW